MLELVNVCKTYNLGENKVEALKSVNLKFTENEFVSILGASGCGKTTMLNIVGGLDHYTSGDLIIDGVSTKNFKDRDWDTYRNHKIGFVFQSYNLIYHLSILENVEMALTLNGVGRAERKKRAIEALKKVGLENQIKKLPNQLSGGQMQRVAIARAIVNNPSIILADEPTGALDSKTSVQIMDILKDLSKDTLIIMVTHNPELAQKYSTRTIELSDGTVISDTSNKSEEQPSTKRGRKPKKEVSNNEQDNKVGVKTQKKRTSMNFLTALYLSLKNFLHKKGRTFLTSFAGSIGIIGVALVLAISNGFTNYINNMQNSTLSGYPISISTATINYDSFNSVSNNKSDSAEAGENEIVVYNPMQQFIKYGHYNLLNENFVNYVKEFEQKDAQKGENSYLNMVQYEYFTPLKIVNKSANGMYNFIQNKNTTSVMSTSSSGAFYEELASEQFMLSYYDVIAEKDYNKDDSNGLTLVIGKGNKLSVATIKALGLDVKVNPDLTFANISFEQVLNKEYKLIFNDQYYKADSENFNEITTFSKVDTTSQTVLQELYENENSQTLKVTRILRVKDDATTSILSDGIMYKPTLAKEYRENCKNSVIALKQLERKQQEIDNNEEYLNFFVNFEFDISEFSGMGIIDANGFANTMQINSFLKTNYGFEITNQEAFEMGMQQIGISSIAQNIRLYPKSFDSKTEIAKMIEDYNSLQTEDYYKIMYADTMEILTSSLGKLIDIISYVLIAFASISLIVSSIMIGIITYVSVIERTKEIGVLRSLGARKKDISRVFNAETIIIGFLAGVLGVAVSYAFCPIINAVVANLAGGSIGKIASLNPLHAIVLIVISMVLTLIGGSIPSSIASKKDPVECLRAE